VKRREFMAGLGSAAGWPLVALAQQPDRMRRIGVLMEYDESQPEGKPPLAAFRQRLTELGWADRRNLSMEVRWAADNVDRMRMFAKELVNLQSDVILASGSPLIAALRRETRTIPIVFAGLSDPVGEGVVAGLRNPGENVTGFAAVESTMGGKWVQLLAEITPGVKRVAIMFNPDTAPCGGLYFLPAFEAAARSLKVDAVTARVHDDTEIETVMTSLGRERGGAIIVQPDVFTIVRRSLIISLAAENKLPAIWGGGAAVIRDGGLLSYGPDLVDIFRRSASYVDRILRGEKPGDLPVQLPVKFVMAVNLKTAKSLGLTVPQSILLRADEVIE
jgi:putative ABC transport system substrate-binding protein